MQGLRRRHVMSVAPQPSSRETWISDRAGWGSLKAFHSALILQLVTDRGCLQQALEAREAVFTG